LEDLVDTVLHSMSNIKRPQRLFMAALFKVLLVFQGKANFRNMSRYSTLSEKRLSRWYGRTFAFAQFNTTLLSHTLSDDQDCIAAIDASFVNKAGKKTDGLGWFYNGSLGQPQRGLEVSMICLVDLKSNTAYALEALQTIDQLGQTRVDRYAEQVVKIAPQLLKQGIVHMAADAYYSKIKFVSAVCAAGLHLVGKLRVDADLQWLYEGQYRGLGRPRKFDGKVNFKKDLGRFEQLDDLDDGVQVYTQVVFSKQLKRTIKVVMLRSVQGDKDSRVLLYSTDSSLDAMRLIQYYKARFQIEFLFRDAKQHTGLTHCQSRRKEAIHTHLNASLVALNLLKLEDQQIKKATGATVISIASWKRKKFNQHLMERLFQELGLSLKSQKVAQVYDQMSDYGAIAA
jgi:hypothetical protein